MVSRAAGEALGKLGANLKNPRWIAAQTAETAFSIWVLNPFGKKVSAYLRKHLFHQTVDDKIGEVYHCDDDHEYIKIGENIYNYDPQEDKWYRSNA